MFLFRLDVPAHAIGWTVVCTMSVRLSFLRTPIPKRCVDLPCLLCLEGPFRVHCCALLVSFAAEFYARTQRGAECIRVSAASTLPRWAAVQRGPILQFCYAAEWVMRHRRSSSKLASTRFFLHLDHAINASSCLVCLGNLSVPILPLPKGSCLV